MGRPRIKKEKKLGRKIEIGLADAYKIGTDISLIVSFIVSFIVLLMTNDSKMGISLLGFSLTYIISFVIITLILYGIAQLFIPFGNNPKDNSNISIYERTANTIGVSVSIIMTLILVLMLSDLCKTISNICGEFDIFRVGLAFMFLIFVILTVTVVCFILKIGNFSEENRKSKSKDGLVKFDINTSIGMSILISVVLSIVYSVGTLEILSSIITIESSNYLYVLFLIIFVMLLTPLSLLVTCQVKTFKDEK